MLSALLDRLSYANVMATVAVFLALGGGAYAAARINGSTIKDRSIPAAKLKKNAVGASEINESSLRGVASASGLARLDYNSASFASPPGPGNAPPPSTLGAVSCDAGQRALGGGVRASDTVTQTVDDSYPRGTDGWEAHVSNFGSAQQSFTVFVICTSADATS